MLASLSRALPAACLTLGLALGLLLAPPAAMAAPAPETAPETVAPGQAAEFKALRDEIAERVREKALFSARVAPKAAGLFRDSRYHYRHDDPDRFIGMLWELRSSPAILDAWLNKLTAPGLSDRDRSRGLDQFESFISETRYLAADLQRREGRNGNLWTKFRDKYLTPPDGGGEAEQEAGEYARAAEKLQKIKAGETAFADALALTHALKAAGADRHDIGGYAPLLLKLKDSPEDLRLAASLIADRDIPRERANALMRKLATDPEGAREDIAKVAETNAIEMRYRYALHEESFADFILLPLASILPEAERAVAKPGVIPLAQYAGTKTEKTLSLKRLERLIPENFHSAAGGGKAPLPLPLLREDERLYAVRDNGAGAAVFAKTPLDPLAFSGPSVTEVGGEKAEEFFTAILPRDRGRDLYLVAAACGPEELAAHLGSLGVMASVREKSLYGPYQDFVRSEEDLRWSSNAKRLKGNFPKDIPGEALRLVRVDSGDTFMTLAPLADKDGLARLMGPIRAVWAREYARYAPEPWNELRYEPSSAKPKAFRLGADPVLGLGKPALRALVAQHGQLVLQAWVNYEQRECGENGDDALCREQYPAVAAAMERKFEAVRAKGFVSPMDMSTALYLLEQHGKEAAKLEAMRAVLGDTTLSSAKRVAAMRKIAEER